MADGLIGRFFGNRKEPRVVARWYSQGDTACLYVKATMSTGCSVEDVKEAVLTALKRVGVNESQESVQVGWEDHRFRGIGVAQIPLNQKTRSALSECFHEIKGAYGFDVNCGMSVACRG